MAKIGQAARRFIIRIRRRVAAVVGDTITVSASTGNDAHDGKTGAVATFARAHELARTDSSVVTIDVLAGTYNETPTAPRAGLQYTFAAGVIIDGGGTRKGMVVSYPDVAISGAGEIRNTSYALHAISAHKLYVAGLTMHDTGQGLYAVACNDAQVSGCTVYNTTTGEGIYMNGGARALVENNTAYNCVRRGIYANNHPDVQISGNYVHDAPNITTDSNYGIEVENGCLRALLLRNWVKACNLGVIIKTSNYGRADGNVAWDCFGSGLYAKGASFGTWVQNDSYHNGQGTDNLYDSTSGLGSSGNVWKNNIVSSSTGYGVRVDNVGSGNTFDYNDYYNNVVAFRNNSAPSTNYTFAAWKTATGQDAHSTTSNPAYVTTVYGGFALPGGSALLAAGTDTGQTSGTPNLGHSGSTWATAILKAVLYFVGDAVMNIGEQSGRAFILAGAGALGGGGAVEAGVPVTALDNTAATAAGGAATVIALATDTPGKVVLNLSEGDLYALPDESTFKSNYGDVIDAILAAWPSTIIYLTKPWRAGYDSEAATLGGWITDVIFAYGASVQVAADEAQVFGLHPERMGADGEPTAAGWDALAQVNLRQMGYLPPVAASPVEFTALTNAAAVDNDITKTSATTAWDSGGTGSVAVGSYGYVTAPLDGSGNEFMLGLGAGDNGGDYATIDYAAHVHEDAIDLYRLGTLVHSDFAIYDPGDALQLLVQDGIVFAYVAGGYVYQFADPVLAPLYANVALSTPGMTLNDVVIGVG